VFCGEKSNTVKKAFGAFRIQVVACLSRPMEDHDKEIEIEYALSILKIGLTQLLAAIRDYMDLSTHSEFIRREELYDMYHVWNRRADGYFSLYGSASYAYLDILNEWLSIPRLKEDGKISDENGLLEILNRKREVIEKFSNVVAPSSDERFYTFLLSKDGTLARDVLGKLETYEMERGGVRYKILVALAETSDRKAYWNTSDLAREVGSNAQMVRKSVDDIKRQMKKRFSGIKASEFIEGKRSSGYRLGRQIRIAEN